jgi:hypothetical protein
VSFARRIVPRPIFENVDGTGLARLYSQGDSENRTCITHATLDQLFDRKTIRKIFADRRNDEAFAIAHEKASEGCPDSESSPDGKQAVVSDGIPSLTFQLRLGRAIGNWLAALADAPRAG